MIDALETEFKKERNETYETYQLLSRKKFINESLEQFHSILSGLAARCNFGTLEDRILRDVFIVNMNNREAHKELCRSTKTPEEVYRIALSYERGNKYASSYVATGSVGAQGSSSRCGGIQIKSEPVGIIRRGYRTIAQGAGAHTKGEDRIEVEILTITTDAITAINKISPENIWTDAPQKELHAIFVTKLDTSNVPVGGNVEISEDGEL